MDKDSLSTGRQCILEQARTLFAMHGYHGASIRDIARACGLSNASLYYHFGNKQNLYFEVIREYISTVDQQLQEAGAGGGSCRERLARMAHAYVQIIVESESEVQTLARDLARFDPEEIRHLLPDIRGRIQATIAQVLEKGIAAGEVRPVDTYRVAILLLGMVSSLVARRLYETAETTLAQDTDLALSILFEGIAR